LPDLAATGNFGASAALRRLRRQSNFLQQQARLPRGLIAASENSPILSTIGQLWSPAAEESASTKKKINLSTSLAGQAVGIKEVDDGIWLVSFMNYDLGYIDLEEKTLQPLDKPFGPRV
jgi:hypothetical protein